MTQGRTLEESERLIAKFFKMPLAKAIDGLLDRAFLFIEPTQVLGLLELIRFKAWTRHRAKGGDQQYEDFNL